MKSLVVLIAIFSSSAVSYLVFLLTTPLKFFVGSWSGELTGQVTQSLKPVLELLVMWAGSDMQTPIGKLSQYRNKTYHQYEHELFLTLLVESVGDCLSCQVSRLSNDCEGQKMATKLWLKYNTKKYSLIHKIIKLRKLKYPCSLNNSASIWLKHLEKQMGLEISLRSISLV